MLDALVQQEFVMWFEPNLLQRPPHAELSRTLIAPSQVPINALRSTLEALGPSVDLSRVFDGLPAGSGLHTLRCALGTTGRTGPLRFTAVTVGALPCNIILLT